MILPIYLYGHPVLRKQTEDIEENSEELQKLIADMWETMYHSDGVGLAAPQIGKSLSVVVIDGRVMADKFEECKDSKLVLINPYLEVIEDEAAVTRDEGCLSLPGMSEPVKRFEHIKMQWIDENFQTHEQKFRGFLSRIIQHEYDHLDGIVYTDRISPIRKQLSRAKLNNIVKGKVDCDYKVKTANKK